jgi:hypothetical protein
MARPSNVPNVRDAFLIEIPLLKKSVMSMLRTLRADCRRCVRCPFGSVECSPIRAEHICCY